MIIKIGYWLERYYFFKSGSMVQKDSSIHPKFKIIVINLSVNLCVSHDEGSVLQNCQRKSQIL